ncbi:LysR substrate-binding domain-containing protein [Vagococcus carniphilus]|uniref:LysR substrate-binding domain-containing protein n=1 Tax=Vagococcus carniphilus TaxID=218144 RepID=A0AAW8U1L4_9ENTE|nr:LysR substrate-binding domain-containing protein [Vagococcus carniphilus]MDT2829352.1 LysR substrate-binding domain-containing protein [Vagococcus carniphilus]MDT2833441.1 LysR substrate-binding domain-containing protein [Vagococcus carniphilus]MDT2838811.1 LysR substrate-binding domain-containing protein [Vagococcus carniphilus]MDT2852869.1 LysR substrate-binding domain-containing protein [Vagococcus carniphilus]
MDIKHLEYFTTIVENNFNLSQSAKTLLISQPGLTKFIKEFENKEDVQLFVRSKGRLVDLTPIGKEFYENALLVLTQYNKLMEDLRINKETIKGTIRVGIPPVILTVLFKKAIPQFIVQNPNIQLEIVEAGAYELQKMLLLQEIDIAFLIDPIITNNIQSKTVVEDQAVVVFNKNHRFTNYEGPISYSNLANERIILLNSTFMIHHQIKKNFQVANITPHIFFESGAWDLLASMCESLDIITILPAPIVPHYSENTLLSRPITPYFSWTVKICQLENVYHSHLVEFVEEFFIDFFKN